MVKISCFIRPHRLEHVRSAIAAIGIGGMSVSDARGTGNSPERSDWFSGDEAVIALPIRSKLEVVVLDDQASEVIEAIVDAARTGQHGDGKIFVEAVSDAIRVRTGERGEIAI